MFKKKGEFLTLSVLAHAQKSKGSMTNGKAGFDNILNVFTRRGASWPSGEASALHPTEQMRFVRVGVNWSMFINEFVTICIQHIKFSETVQYFRFFLKLCFKIMVFKKAFFEIAKLFHGLQWDNVCIHPYG